MRFSLSVHTRLVIFKSAKKWYLMHMCISRLWPTSKKCSRILTISIHQFKRKDYENNIFNKMKTTRKMLKSFIIFSQLILWGNVWRPVWRMYMWILVLKGLITRINWKFQVGFGKTWWQSPLSPAPPRIWLAFSVCFQSSIMDGMLPSQFIIFISTFLVDDRCHGHQAESPNK